MSHWQAKTKIRRVDALFSRYIRLRDGRCIYSIKCYGYCDYENLTASHFWGRVHESTRFDPLNVDAACRKCHAYVTDTEEGKRWLKEFKRKQLGEKEYNLLELRHNTYKKKDDKMAMFIVKALLLDQERTAPR